MFSWLLIFCKMFSYLPYGKGSFPGRGMRTQMSVTWLFLINSLIGRIEDKISSVYHFCMSFLKWSSYNQKLLKAIKTKPKCTHNFSTIFIYVLRSTNMETNYSNLLFTYHIHLYAVQFNLRIKLSTVLEFS